MNQKRSRPHSPAAGMASGVELVAGAEGHHPLDPDLRSPLTNPEGTPMSLFVSRSRFSSTISKPRGRRFGRLTARQGRNDKRRLRILARRFIKADQTWQAAEAYLISDKSLPDDLLDAACNEACDRWWPYVEALANAMRDAGLDAIRVEDLLIHFNTEGGLTTHDLAQIKSV